MDIVKERPIVFFDLETTGVNIMTDRIIEISVVKIFPDGKREVKT
ncbi:MAG: 3'-5' exonuclease, partial [Lentisphaeria bacterium]|nr:3'-5' exonuclease [Lentisphaeria bacterium]